MSIRFSLALLLMFSFMSQLLQQVDGRKKLCGEALNEALEMICVKGFKRRLNRNRRDLDNGSQDQTPEQALLYKWRLLALMQELDGLEKEPRYGPVEPKRRSAAGKDALIRPRRSKITHECCKDGCTYDDILDYCA